jgi:hypothetical protein
MNHNYNEKVHTKYKHWSESWMYMMQSDDLTIFILWFVFKGYEKAFNGIK